MGDEISLDERTIASLQRRIRALENALRPFADTATAIDDAPGGEDCPDQLRAEVKLGDCRRAAELLAHT